MGRVDKTFEKILESQSDYNIRFKDLLNLLNKLEFRFRIKGDHHIYYRNDIDEIINLQPLNDKAKPYQVKQVRVLILKYKLKLKK